jgi:hypothetical protein
MNMLKLKVISCDVLRREVSYLAGLSPCYVDTVFLPQGLHESPDKLRAMLNEEIEKANQEFPRRLYEKHDYYDYIILVYGLCDNSIVGLKSSRVPLAIPRAHDCITLLLGSKERYATLYEENPGTYWYSRGWIERSLQPGKERYERAYEAYVEKYGEDNADYLMEMEQGWFKAYSKAFFIDWQELGNSEYYRSFTKESAVYLKWNYEEIAGDPSLLAKMFRGEFDENEVLLVEPGKTVAASYSEGIIRCG